LYLRSEKTSITIRRETQTSLESTRECKDEGMAAHARGDNSAGTVGTKTRGKAELVAFRHAPSVAQPNGRKSVEAQLRLQAETLPLRQLLGVVELERWDRERPIAHVLHVRKLEKNK
jgi:hypothetical protein